MLSIFLTPNHSMRRAYVKNKINYNCGNPRNVVTHGICTILWDFIISYLKRPFQNLWAVLAACLQNFSNCLLSSAWKLCYFILAFPYRCLATISNSKQIELLWYLLNFPFVIKRNYSKTFHCSAQCLTLYTAQIGCQWMNKNFIISFLSLKFLMTIEQIEYDFWE